jgi:hypothetical protein
MPPDISNTEIGRIEALNVRASLHDLPRQVSRARSVAGLGLEGDVHAHPHSLRQLLLAGSPAYRSLELPPQTLRENLLLTAATSDMKSGTVLAVGDTALLWLTFQCEACGHLNDHVDGAAKAIGANRGMLARVLRDGEIAIGDTVRDLGCRMPAWSDDWKRRVVQILDAMPPDTVIEYKQLAWLAGIAPNYCRVFPRFLRGLGRHYEGRAVPATDRTTTPRWRGEGLHRTHPSLLFN